MINKVIRKNLRMVKQLINQIKNQKLQKIISINHKKLVVKIIIFKANNVQSLLLILIVLKLTQ